MNFYRAIKVCFLVPAARRHLLKTMQKLESNSYHQIINEKLPPIKNKKAINTIVKSYFWAARTIVNCHCLPRSIALYQKLMASGFLVEHKLGVNKNDKNLAAHAWVEYKNKPLNEPQDLVHKFTVLEHPNQKI